MVFINQTESLGIIVVQMTSNLTGSLFLSLMLIMILLFAFCISFRIPMEFSAVIMLPLILVCWAFMSDFTAIGGVTLIYLAIIFVKMFFLN